MSSETFYAISLSFKIKFSPAAAPPPHHTVHGGGAWSPVAAAFRLSSVQGKKLPGKVMIWERDCRGELQCLCVSPTGCARGHARAEQCS